jgi:hypothetical protein
MKSKFYLCLTPSLEGVEVGGGGGIKHHAFFNVDTSRLRSESLRPLDNTADEHCTCSEQVL